MSASVSHLLNDGNVLDSKFNGQPNISAAVIEPAKSAVMHRSLHCDPLRVVSAKGHYLHLSNGQRIFDASGGAAVACLGHADDRIRDALVEQMNKVSYCHSLFYSTQAAEELATLLVDSTYGEMARAFLVSSGSEAMEAALKLARQYHLEKQNPEVQRTRFISRHQSYHGTTLGALAAGGHVARRALFEPILSSNTSRVSPCYAYRGLSQASPSSNDEATYVEKLEAELEAEFQRVGPQNVAAFVAEPVVGAALGCVPPVAGYFSAMRRVCDRHGALLIFDEVMSDVGRVGPASTQRFPTPLHAWQDPLIGVAPDLMTLGKGLGGGYVPVAALLAASRVVDTLHSGSGAFSHGQTYQGHPLACSAALAVQTIIRREGLVANVRKQGALLGTLLQENLGSCPYVGDIRGSGLFWGIEFVRDKATKDPFDPAEAVAMGVHELGMQKPYNISLYPGTGGADGRRGDHVIVAPAYNITAEEVRQLVEVANAVVREYFARTSADTRMRKR